MNEQGKLVRLTNDVIGLWLNKNHYDMVLNFSQFIFGGITILVKKCMHNFSSRKEYIYSFNVL